MPSKLAFQANCKTTAMGIMPHRNVERALKLALDLDVPYWPQLPNLGYYEDMYAQASEHFPGVTVDVLNKHISFSSRQFEDELADYSTEMADPALFSLNEAHSVVYHRFLREDLARYAAIRGQVIGPVSYGFKVMDENNMPVIYSDQVRPLLFDFIARKVNAQYHELAAKNPHAFVWLDEPGLGWVFSGLSGFSDVRAKEEYDDFLKALDGPPALHLCASVNLPYLLSLGMAVLSFDAFQMDVMPKGYAQSVAGYLAGGGIISWGIVPTDSLSLSSETPETLTDRLLKYWEVVSANSDVPAPLIAKQSLIAPARCSLKNLGQVGALDEKSRSTTKPAPDSTIEERSVELAFDYLHRISESLKHRFGF